MKKGIILVYISIFFDCIISILKSNNFDIPFKWVLIASIFTIIAFIVALRDLGIFIKNIENNSEEKID